MTDGTPSPVLLERLRVAAAALAPPGALELYCERCGAFQGHLTADALLLGGCKLTQPVRLYCRACGHEWHDRGPQRGSHGDQR